MPDSYIIWYLDYVTCLSVMPLQVVLGRGWSDSLRAPTRAGRAFPHPVVVAAAAVVASRKKEHHGISGRVCVSRADANTTTAWELGGAMLEAISSTA